MRWRVIILCSLVILLDGYDTSLAGLTLSNMAKDWATPPASFGLALSGALLGMALGAALIAPLGDRFGRRPIIIVNFIAVGALTLAVPFCTSITEFVLLRFAVGLGMGASLTNALALVSEFALPRIRSLTMTITFSMVGTGAIISGLIVPTIMEHHGWQGAYYAGGLLPLAIAIAMIAALPESDLFLAKRKSAVPGDVLLATTRAPINISVLLSRPFVMPTLLLWTLQFIGNFCTYLVGSWLPTLMRGAGWSIGNASFALTAYSAGSVVSGIALAWLIDRNLARPALIGGYALAVVSLGCILMIAPVVSIWIPLIILLGGGMSGTAYLLAAISGRIYPVSVRATGIGMAWGIAKLGATISPLAGGGMMALGFSSIQILASLFAPMLLALVLAQFFSHVFRDAEG